MDKLDPAFQAISSLSMSGFIYILEECGSVDAIFQDFAKAFKKVSHLHLLLKRLRRTKWWKRKKKYYYFCCLSSSVFTSCTLANMVKMLGNAERNTRGV